MVDIKKIWDSMKENDTAITTMKLYQKTNDQKPFRALIFVDGIEEVENVLNAMEQKGYL